VLGGKVAGADADRDGVAQRCRPNAKHRDRVRLKGKGFPAHGGEAAGDLYARLMVTLPDGPDADLQKFAEGWKADYDPRRNRGRRPNQAGPEPQPSSISTLDGIL